LPAFFTFPGGLYQLEFSSHFGSLTQSSSLVPANRDEAGKTFAHDMRKTIEFRSEKNTIQQTKTRNSG
jgi:hypothetical protein